MALKRKNSVLEAEWIYEIVDSYGYWVRAKCSNCGWKWFSEDGVGNYHSVFGAHFTNYRDDPETANLFLLDNAKKLNRFICCPVCGARMKNVVQKEKGPEPQTQSEKQKNI